ncbi:unnamed protein product [Sphagnum troendelagicum]|uniref:Uncharacterized protein n=1 Tax=Sphagnum troendelagicum TaxID=128251 RepID=A0ABP0UV46_9BRYO
MGKNRSNAQKHLQEQEDEEEKNKKVHVAHYKDYAACVLLLHPEPSSSHKAGNIAYDVEREIKEDVSLPSVLPSSPGGGVLHQFWKLQ